MLFYEINSFIRKQLAHEGISKYFFLDHFSSSFLGQKYYFFVTYFILTGETKVEFVIYWVLNPYATKNVASVIYRMKPLQNAAFWTVASEKTTLCGNNSVYVLVMWLTTTIE